MVDYFRTLLLTRRWPAVKSEREELLYSRLLAQSFVEQRSHHIMIHFSTVFFALYNICSSQIFGSTGVARLLRTYMQML